MSFSLSRTRLPAILLIMFTGSLIYSNTLNVPFLFDDEKNIQNPALRIEHGTADEMLTALSKGTLKKRPVSNLSFAFNYYLGGYRVQGYHLVNIVIHLFSGIFLYLLLRTTLALPVNKEKYGSFPELALVTALLWLVHPLATQSVTYLVQRMNSMAAMFYILALLLYIMGRNRQMRVERRQSSLPAWGWFVAGGLSGLLAIGSKEIAATLPVIIFIYEWYFFQDLKWGWLKKRIYWLLGAVSVFGGLVFFYLGKAPWQVFLSECSNRDFTAYERLLTQFRVVIKYISLLLYPNPNRLALDYDFPFSTSLFSPVSTLYSLMGLLALLFFALILARRERLLSFCILWFFVTLVIESSVICLEIIFEHRTYLPSMFFLLFAGAILYRVGINSRIVSAVLVLIIMLFGFWTFDRNRDWKDAVTFWESNISVYPEKARTHLNLGLALHYAGKLDKAEKEYRISIKLSPNAEIPHNNLARLLLEQGERKDAELYFRKAVRLKPDFVIARYSLGVLLRENGEYEEALAQLFAALKKEPDNTMVRKQLGNTLLRFGKPGEALPYLQKARLEWPKDTEILLDVAESLTNTGQREQAISVYRDVLSMDNRQVSAHFNLALLLQQKGEVEETVKHYQSAARLFKAPEGLLYNYGNQLFRLGEHAEAERIYRKFLKITPVIVDTYNNFGLLLLNQGRYKEAVNLFTIARGMNPRYQLVLNNLRMATELLNAEMQKEKSNKDEAQ